VVARVAQSVALGLLIQYFSEGTNHIEGYLWAFVLVFCGIVTLFEHHHSFMATWRKGLQLKTGKQSLVRYLGGSTKKLIQLLFNFIFLKPRSLQSMPNLSGYHQLEASTLRRRVRL